ncbi:MAG: class I SAM-dependent methyltransferase [Terriglobales bacterium]
MGVAAHLGIELERYDRSIRQFIPGYDEMLEAAAAASGRRGPLLDLGIGTGALAARCLAHARQRRVIGLDADSDMLAQARRRLGARARLVTSDFTRAPLPGAGAIVSALALHHVEGTRRKLGLYRACHAALARGGVLVNADCCPAAEPELAKAQFAAWREHMRRSFGARKVEQMFAAWAAEDHYLPLTVELRLLRRAGFAAEVVWRQGCFAVIAATGLWPRGPQPCRA